MGAKQTRAGQHLFLYAAGLMIWAWMATGCLHWPPPSPEEQQLLEARQLFANGDYRRALEINQRILVHIPAHLADRSLFQIGLIYAHPANPDRDVQKASESFQRIVDRYPSSPLHPNAAMWLAMLGQLRAQENQIRVLTQRSAPLEKTVKMQKRKIIQLQDQLEKLKHIDIKMEEKKRETIPQAEEIEEKGNGKNSGS